jgi:DNA-binding transcriptional LysR family regulator
MDTRQLAAFCAVVERRSFSQAAERLGVTQPAVSLQVRALEKRLGTQLLDRSGRRVAPTEAGLRLYRGAQRLLALEEQLVAEVGGESEGTLGGTLEIGASTGPGGIVLAQLLCDFHAQNPDLHVQLSVFDTQTVVERVADRSLELGVVGAARRHRGVVFEPFFRDEVILACPPGHRFAGKTVTLDELREETLIVMQEGAGVRQMIEDELRRVGTRLRDLDVRLELGLQESVTTAVRAGYGVTFISRSSVEPDLAAKTVVEARVEGLDLEREISLVRASGRAEKLIVMQEGAGVRQMIEDELRRAGTRLRDLDVRIELGLQESVTSAVRAGYGVTFISRRSVESDLAAGTLTEARVRGLELGREISLVRATGRAETRAARAFVDFARARLP